MVAVVLFICELSQGLSRYLLHKILFSLVSNILNMYVGESVPLLSGRENPLKKKSMQALQPQFFYHVMMKEKLRYCTDHIYVRSSKNLLQQCLLFTELPSFVLGNPLVVATPATVTDCCHPAHSTSGSCFLSTTTLFLVQHYLLPCMDYSYTTL